MNPHDDRSVEARVERLERLVEDLRRQLAERPAAATAVAAPVQASAAEAAPPAARPRVIETRPAAPRMQWDGQLWLNRLGIGMVLLGVALLFRYSIEQGWLTPAVRVGFGAALGAALFAAGLRLDRRRRFAEVLLGGGVATFYIVGWAAFHLYGLIGYLPAFAGMVAITCVAFTMALGRGAASLAVLGAVGGLGTPLILGVTLGTPRGFALYTSLVLAWTAAVYLQRGWRWLLWTALPGGWLLLFVYARHLPPEAISAPADRWTLQISALFAWVVLGALPLARRVRDHARATAPERHWHGAEAAHWYALAILPPHALLMVGASTWHPQPETWGVWTLVLGAAYAGAAWALYRADVRVSRAVLFTASLLVSFGSIAAFGGDALLLSLAAQALVLHALAGRGGGAPARWLAHKVYIAAGAWLLWRLAESGDTSPARVITDLAVLACGFLASYLLRTRRTVLAYRYFVHAGVLGWLWRELAPLEGGQGFATIAWCAYALALLLVALKQGWPLLEKTAIATLLLVVAKLFLVDLAELDALFRVALFLGFGLVFLVLSYTLQAWWKNVRPQRDAAPELPPVR